MKRSWILVLAICILACSDSKVYDRFIDLPETGWAVQQRIDFDLTIPSDTIAYDGFGRVRNESDYNWSRLFIQYVLLDSVGKVMDDRLLEFMLFDPKTGKAYGKSGLGDIYDHELKIFEKYKFPARGKYKVRLTQMMRTDTLTGIHAVGVAVLPAEEISQ